MSEHLDQREDGRPHRWAAPMRRAILLLSLIVGGLIGNAHRGMTATVLPDQFLDSLVVSGLRLPTSMAFLPDGRALVTERLATLRLIVNGGFGVPDPVTGVDSVEFNFFESGLLGIAIDPRWPAYPYVYVFYDAVDSTIRVSRFRAAGDLNNGNSPNLTINRNTRYDVLRNIPDRNVSHNGGTLRFGPDSMLYVGLADDESMCSAQDTTSLRGVMLRLDVRGLPDVPGGPPNPAVLAPPDNPFASHPHPNARLVWALGLRNPYRFHVDQVTGGIFVADVGWSLHEELDLVEFPGQNFGWPYYEGPQFQAPPCAADSAAVFAPPIHFYNRDAFPVAAVVSAGVYRCADCPAAFPAEYEGDYFFADFYEGFLRRLKQVNGTWEIASPVPGQPSPDDWGQGFDFCTDFVTAPNGDIWYLKYTGHNDTNSQLRRILNRASLLDVDRVPLNEVEFDPPRPSPTRGPVTLAYHVSRGARVELNLFDVTGRRVRRLAEPAAQPPGPHALVWDGRDDDGRQVRAGLFLAVLSVDGVTYQRRIPLLR